MNKAAIDIVQQAAWAELSDEGLRLANRDTFGPWNLDHFSKTAKEAPGADLLDKLKSLSASYKFAGNLFPRDLLRDTKALNDDTEARVRRELGLPLEGNKSFSDKHFDLYCGSFAAIQRGWADLLNAVIERFEKAPGKKGILEGLVEDNAKSIRAAMKERETRLEKFGWKFTVDGERAGLDRYFQDRKRFTVKNTDLFEKTLDLEFYFRFSGSLLQALRLSDATAHRQEAALLASKREVIQALVEELLKDAKSESKDTIALTREQFELKK